MAVSVASTSLAAATLAMGREIVEDDALAVVRMLNYAAAESPSLCLQLRPEDQHDCPNPTGSEVEVYRTKWYVAPHYDLITAYTDWTVVAGNEVTINVTIGAHNEDLVVDDGDMIDEVDFSTGDTGTGLLEVIVTIQRTAGASASNTFDYLLIEAKPIDAGDLAAPTG